MSGLSQAEAFARIRLLRSPRIGPVSFAQLLARYGSGEAAVEAWASGDWDAILMDIHMPRMDGMEATAGGMDLLCIGSIGVGGATSSAAVLASLFGGDAREWIPAEADELVYDRKVSAVGRALETHAGRLGDPFEVLRRLGGRESAAIVGAILAARAQKIPVILDGLTATAAAAALHAANPRAVEHCRLATAPSDPVHRMAAERADLQAVLSIDLDLQAGAGAALAVGFVKSAALCLAGMQPLPGSV